MSNFEAPDRQIFEFVKRITCARRAMAALGAKRDGRRGEGDLDLHHFNGGKRSKQSKRELHELTCSYARLYYHPPMPDDLLSSTRPTTSTKGIVCA